MPTIEENRRVWGVEYGWPDGGEEWSEVWGGSEAQWRGTILPRIRGLLPAAAALEIGCGFGRYSARLREWCDRLVLVDLVERCVSACRERFAGDSGVSVSLTDGFSLPGVAERSLDFVFSFDSLVHAEIDVLSGYLGEIARTLSRDGAAFLHHSNMGAVLAARPGSENRHWRGESVSAELVREAAAARGLLVVRQEIVEWGGVVDGDCLTTVVRPEGARAAEPRVVRNPFFMEEAQSLAVRARLYGAPGAGPDRGGEGGG